jgi:hypothetical protein
MRYYAMTDPPEFTLERPLSLLRPPAEGVIEHYATNGRWHPDGRYSLLSGESDHDLVELTTDQAERLQWLWTAGDTPAA